MLSAELEDGERRVLSFEFWVGKRERMRNEKCRMNWPETLKEASRFRPTSYCPLTTSQRSALMVIINSGHSRSSRWPLALQ